MNPPELRAKVAAAGKLIWERNQGAYAEAPAKKAKTASAKTKAVTPKKTEAAKKAKTASAKTKAVTPKKTGAQKKNTGKSTKR